MFPDKNISESDDLLIDKILAGEKSALEKLILKHQNWIYNVALAHGRPSSSRTAGPPPFRMAPRATLGPSPPITVMECPS